MQQYRFITPTADTREMILAAREVLTKIYKPDVRYAKAGVILGGICQHDEVQLDMFSSNTDEPTNNADADSNEQSNKDEALMEVMDILNRKYKHDKHQQATLFIASEGIKEKQDANEP